MPLTNPLDWLILFVLAAASGVVGGVCAAVIAVYYPAAPPSPPQTLTAEWPRLALIGAVAAVAVMYVNSPTTVLVTQEADGTVTSTTVTYDLLKVIPLGLIAGSAGRAVISVLQSRITAAINAQKKEDVAVVGKQLAEDVGEAAKTEVQAAVAGAMVSAREGVQRLVQESAREAAEEDAVVEEGVAEGHSSRGTARTRPVTVSDEAIQRVLESAGGGAVAAAESRLDDRIASARKTIDAVSTA